MVHRSKRRHVLQLTPLLDLLMIVMFAQYMAIQSQASAGLQQVQAAAIEREAEASERESGLVKRVEDAEELTDTVEGENQGKALVISSLRKQLGDAKERMEELERRLLDEEEQKKALERKAAEEQKRLAQVAGELLDIPPDALESAFEDLTSEERERLKRQFEDMRGKSAEALLRHLRTVDEMKKRIDLWEIHLGDYDRVRLIINAESIASNLAFDNESDLVLALGKILERLVEPKGMVLTLLSHGPKSTRGGRRTWDAAVRRAIEGRRNFYDRQKSFQIADLGYLDESQEE